MQTEQILHPVSAELTPLEADDFDTLFQLFEQIGVFWGNMADSQNHRSQLYRFMQNRTALRPIYYEYYAMAAKTLNELIAQMGQQQAYVYLFTDQQINQKPATTPQAITRQYVSNEFVALQLSLGGFAAYGAQNYPGYIGGGYISGQPAPYRTGEAS
ncbi:hypothetical protein [Magnetofaba australis]|uniref:Uncharacterized protein n=1 Tax=Magnetofaba australis IT-1 TaxID=1434232 RepID=A0A1Y2K8E6_9PROT|nr:hypothetical protein [Magnetofaba australis]OSM05065.1 hypothetical protein MAIT1_03203 [Magnetofaba australis IT-1]